MGASSHHLNCDFAFYTTPVTPLNKTEGLSSLLQDTKRNNVLLESGISVLPGAWTGYM